MDLLTERRLRDVLALRRIGEATLLRDSDKVSELMNLHRTILSCERRFVEAAIGFRAATSESQRAGLLLPARAFFASSITPCSISRGISS